MGDEREREREREREIESKKGGVESNHMQKKDSVRTKISTPRRPMTPTFGRSLLEARPVLGLGETDVLFSPVGSDVGGGAIDGRRVDALAAAEVGAFVTENHCPVKVSPVSCR
jgi:hypothetical protein